MSSAFVLVRNKTKYNPRKNERELLTFYQCLYCKKEFDKIERAQACVDSHELILVPIAKTDLDRLNKFLYLKDDKLLTQELVSIISRYRTRGSLR